jgi:hypothetical protein
MKAINTVICVLVILLHHQAQGDEEEVSIGYIRVSGGVKRSM